MAIADDTNIKAVQEINLPDAVVALNVYYYQTDFETDQQESDILDACEGAMEAMYGELTAEIASDVTLGTMYMYKYLAPTDEWELVGTRSPSVTFNAVGDMLPHGVAALVRTPTTRAKTTGRKYIPGFDEGTQSDGDWTAGTITNLGDYASDWRSDRTVVGANVLRAGSFSTTLKDVQPFGTTSVVLAQPAYQRRRRPGVGS